MRQSRLYNSITPWCSGLLQKLTGSQLVKELPHFMKTDGSLLQSQDPATWSYLNPNQSSLCPQSHFFKYLLILFFHLCMLRLPSFLFPSVFPSKTPHEPFLSPIRATCPAHLIILTVRNTDHKAPHNVVFSTSLLPCPS